MALSYWFYPPFNLIEFQFNQSHSFYANDVNPSWGILLSLVNVILTEQKRSPIFSCANLAMPVGLFVYTDYIHRHMSDNLQGHVSGENRYIFQPIL